MLTSLIRTLTEQKYIYPIRNRVMLACCIIVIITIGLASRKYTFLFPESLGKYPGDALWSWMVYLIWAFFKPTASITKVSLYAMITAYLVEFGQLIQSPWLNAFRKTTIGHLLLGTVFSWHDILAYTIGIGIALVADHVMLRILNRLPIRLLTFKRILLETLFVCFSTNEQRLLSLYCGGNHTYHLFGAVCGFRRLW